MKQIIRSVLQTHLNQLGQFNTAWEGVLNTPKLPYQTLHLTISSSDTGAISDRPHAEELGFLQLTLFYEAAIRRHFYGQSFIKDNVQIIIHKPPLIGGIFFNDNKLALPVTINFTAYEL